MVPVRDLVCVERTLDGIHQLAHAERLDEQVTYAEAHGLNRLLARCITGKEDERAPAEGHQLIGQFQPAHLRQFELADDQIVRLDRFRLDSLFAARNAGDVGIEALC
jgi:hypothetical protein